MRTDDTRGQLRPVYHQWTVEETRTVISNATPTGAVVFDGRVNELLASGWRRDGRVEAVRVSGDEAILIQCMVRAVPLDVDDGEEQR